MCVGIIGHCSCVRCLEQPNPGKLLRVDFCNEHQERLRGVWKRSLPVQPTIALCPKVTFKRVHDPNSCHCKGVDAVETEQNASTAAAERPSEEPAVVAPWFAAANQSAAIPNADKGKGKVKETQPAPQAGHERAEKEAPTGKFKEPAQHPSQTDREEEPSFPTILKFTPINRKPAVSTSENRPRGGLDSGTPPAGNPKEKEKSATATSKKPDNIIRKRTPLPSSRPRPRPAVSASTSASGTPAPTPDPDTDTDNKSGEEEGEEHSAPQPGHSRPYSPPLVREADGARPGCGPWTVEETIKLLALKSKGLGYSQMQPGLAPGRDELSCYDRIHLLAVKYGYEEYID
ncbi:uncharacterized protein B0T15DRAFT_555378 [Chaetomium strumarium]|uniref:Uncharacterized protein n=1 Tax=Chaetomium strumarium TaxID=1170767 RepID=A0AAJ0GSJ8_9PEZI|nr:hypothetical protein B0T15DRAFT_555378 [Chaetomium strumarium]